ncbi:MAG TPA: hypothetical protein PLH56_07340 [Candidatus Omnitrophota bacterium]|nr:hypothetical protein [Candidatus Omnitrophota bacterium]
MDMEILKYVNWAIGLTALFIGLYVYMQKQINAMGDKLLSNDRFIKAVASNVRPYFIFNENGAHIFDGGALQYIYKDGLIIEGFNQAFKPFQISVRFNCYLSIAPHLESLDCALYRITPERGEGNSWIYKMENEMISGQIVSHRFRLEILK